MKVNIFLGIVILAVIYLTCKGFQKDKTSDMSAAAPYSTAPPPGESRVLKILGDRPDSTGSIQFSEPPPRVNVPWDKVAKPSTSRRAFMTAGWWNPTTALQPTDTSVYRYFKPKWLKFKDDQTFDILVQNKVVDTGHWAYDEAKTTLYLSCNDPYFNNTWRIMERGFRMIMIGNTELNITGIQVRLDNQKELPAN